MPLQGGNGRRRHLGQFGEPALAEAAAGAQGGDGGSQSLGGGHIAAGDGKTEGDKGGIPGCELAACSLKLADGGDAEAGGAGELALRHPSVSAVLLEVGAEPKMQRFFESGIRKTRAG
jgi:hypothetical protein